MSGHLLSWVLFTPLLGMLLLLFIPGRNKQMIKIWANVVALVGFLISIPLLTGWNNNEAGMQFVERADWIPTIGATYSIGVDGISMLLVLLTTFMGLISILCSWSAIEDRLKEYYAMFLLLQVGMLGVFVAQDFFLFYVFWELVLIPMYFIIAIWGGDRKLYSAIKFFLYTAAGSVLMLLGILVLYFQHQHQFGYYTFEIAKLMNLNLPLGIQRWVFWALFLGFAVKVPMFPFHTWLPDAHTDAPTAGSVILAGVLLKMGTYGFIRFSLPLLPKAAIDPTIVQILAVLSIIGIVYGGLVSLMQKDWKRLVAYSSVSHLGFCTLGIFAMTPAGLSGSVIQQINHGLSTGMLFLIVGVIYERRHTRMIAEYGGLAHVMPGYAVVFAIAMLSSAGLPMLNGFIGEFTILAGTFEVNKTWAAFATSGVVLAAAYLLWLYQRTMLGKITNPKNEGLKDLNFREWAIFVPIIALCFAIGLYPKPMFDILDKPVAQIVTRVRPDYFQNKNKPAEAKAEPSRDASQPSRDREGAVQTTPVAAAIR